MKNRIEELFTIYKDQELVEAKFVKAIDKLEPYVHFFHEKRRIMFALNQVTAEKAMSIKEPYMLNFPFIQKCNRVIHERLIDGDYYWKEGE